MLILFDIDGTILLSQRAGISAMRDAGCELFGNHFTFDGIDVAGRLDVLIWNDLCSVNAVPNTQQNHDLFRQTYGRKLAHRLETDNTARLLPGVAELVNHLNALPEVTLGLLTGNYPETGRLKIRHAGLDPDLFTVAAWGCEGASRRELPPIAMQRHRDLLGRAIPAEHVVIIGDTPHDIDCARAHNCRSLGVATGHFSIDDLTRAGADLAVATLADTETIANWLLQRVLTISE